MGRHEKRRRVDRSNQVRFTVQFRPSIDGSPPCVGVVVDGSDEVGCVLPIAGDLTEVRAIDISRRMTTLVSTCLCINVTSTEEIPGFRGSSIFNSKESKPKPEVSACRSSVLEPEDGLFGSIVVDDDGVGYCIEDDFHGLLPIVGAMSNQRRVEIATSAASLISACIAPDFDVRIGPTESM